MLRHLTSFFFFIFLWFASCAQVADPYQPDYSLPGTPDGYHLIWHDEFDENGAPDSTHWSFEKGFVRNNELQWYQPENATCKNGVLLIEGKPAHLVNTHFDSTSPDWRHNRQFAAYTSASLLTKDKFQWRFGRMLVRARIDTAKGAWPAIWTLGTQGEWPANGEVDVMEYYRVKDEPTILANVAWGTAQQYVAKWDSERLPLTHFTSRNPRWCRQFHTWRMDWNSDLISLYLDDELLNTTTAQQSINSDGTNPFLQPQFILLNLALGGNGADPSHSHFPITYEVDYVRVYQPD